MSLIWSRGTLYKRLTLAVCLLNLVILIRVLDCFDLVGVNLPNAVMLFFSGGHNFGSVLDIYHYVL